MLMNKNNKRAARSYFARTATVAVEADILSDMLTSDAFISAMSGLTATYSEYAACMFSDEIDDSLQYLHAPYIDLPPTGFGALYEDAAHQQAVAFLRVGKDTPLGVDPSGINAVYVARTIPEHYDPTDPLKGLVMRSWPIPGSAACTAYHSFEALEAACSAVSWQLFTEWLETVCVTWALEGAAPLLGVKDLPAFILERNRTSSMLCYEPAHVMAQRAMVSPRGGYDVPLSEGVFADEGAISRLQQVLGWDMDHPQVTRVLMSADTHMAVMELPEAAVVESLVDDSPELNELTAADAAALASQTDVDYLERRTDAIALERARKDALEYATWKYRAGTVSGRVSTNKKRALYGATLYTAMEEEQTKWDTQE